MLTYQWDSTLVRWREDYTDEVIAHARVEKNPRLSLERYLSIASRLQPGREVAIRAWAAKDRNVRAVLEHTDASRLEFVQRLGHAMFPHAAEAEIHRFARLACLAFIGFQQTGPHGRERFVALVQDVLDLAGPRDAVHPTPKTGPIAPPQSAEAPARRLLQAAHPESDAGR